MALVCRSMINDNVYMCTEKPASMVRLAFRCMCMCCIILMISY